jgi:acyl-CoA reductase-like NAD-dependent aldehyde dehydrogenase
MGWAVTTPRATFWLRAARSSAVVLAVADMLKSSSAAAIRQTIRAGRLASHRPCKVPKIVRIQHLLLSRTAPTGFGIGREGSKYGIEEYLEIKSFHIGGPA